MRRVAGKDRTVGIVNDPLFGSVIIMLLGDGIVCETIFQTAGEREDKVTADIDVKQGRLEMKIPQVPVRINMRLCLKGLLIGVHCLVKVLEVVQRRKCGDGSLTN